MRSLDAPRLVAGAARAGAQHGDGAQERFAFDRSSCVACCLRVQPELLACCCLPSLPNPFTMLSTPEIKPPRWTRAFVRQAHRRSQRPWLGPVSWACHGDSCAKGAPWGRPLGAAMPTTARCTRLQAACPLVGQKSFKRNQRLRRAGHRIGARLRYAPLDEKNSCWMDVRIRWLTLNAN